MIAEIHKKYGFEAMREVWIEELIELLSVLQRSKRHEVIDRAVITEIADVSFCIDQMMYFYGKDECLTEKDFKMQRTKKRLL